MEPPPDNEDDVLITVACARGLYYIVKLLLERGANPNSISRYGFTPIFIAATHGHADIVRLLLDQKTLLIDFSGWQKTYPSPHTTRVIQTAFVRAIRNDDIACVDAFFSSRSAKALTEITHEKQDVPIFEVLRCANLRIFNLFLRNGAVNDTSQTIGDCPLLHRFLFLGNPTQDGVKIFDHLCKTGFVNADYRDSSGYGFAHDVAACSWINLIYVSKHASLDFNIQSIHGQTPIFEASANSTSALLDLGIDVNCQDSRGQTSLHYITKNPAGYGSRVCGRGDAWSSGEWKRHSEGFATEEFLSKFFILISAPTIDLHLADDMGRTVLHYAVLLRSNIVEVVGALLKISSVEVNATDKDGFTPFDWLCVHFYVIFDIEMSILKSSGKPLYHDSSQWDTHYHVEQRKALENTFDLFLETGGVDERYRGKSVYQVAMDIVAEKNIAPYGLDDFWWISRYARTVILAS